MILADVLLRFLPELVVVVTPDHVATDARDLLHVLIVRRKGFENTAARRAIIPGAASTQRRSAMADSGDRGGIAGISLGGIIVIVGIVLIFVWSFLGGLIVVLVGLIAFGGFARGKWY
jgi:hypothetical protein